MHGPAEPDAYGGGSCVGPISTKHVLTHRSSGSIAIFCCSALYVAFAIAEFRHCAIGSAARLSVNFRIDKRTRHILAADQIDHEPAFRGLPFRYFVFAIASIFLLTVNLVLSAVLFPLRHLLRFRSRMSLEHTRRRKLTQLVADHVLGHKDRNVTFAVVNAECQSDHIRRDRRAARPCLDRGRLLARRR